MTQQRSHVPGVLKQKNKTHKTGSHKSKRKLKINYANASKPQKIKQNVTKKQRNLQNKQKILEKSKIAKLNLKNIGIGLAHIPITLISTSDSFTHNDIISAFQSNSNYIVSYDWINTNVRDYFHVESINKQEKYLFLIATQDSAYYLHDLIHASFIIWILRDSHSDETSFESIFDTFESVSLPPIYHLFKDLPNKEFEDPFDFGSFSVDSLNTIYCDNNITTSTLCKGIPKGINTYKSLFKEKNERKNVSVISEKIFFRQSSNRFGNLEVQGFVRGGSLSPNDYINIPGFGHFQIYSISINDTVSNIVITKTNNGNSNYIDSEVIEISQCEDNNQNSLSFNTNSMDIVEDNRLSDSESSNFTEEDESHLKREENIFEYEFSIDKCMEYKGMVNNPQNIDIVKLHNINGVRNKALQRDDCSTDSFTAGQYVKLILENIHEDLYEYFNKIVGRMILYRLYPFEQKLSVVQYLITKKDYSPDIFSDKKYIFFVGQRKMSSTVVFSSPLDCKSRCHKILPIVTGASEIIVSLISYVTFPHVPVIMFSESESTGELLYIGSGHIIQDSSDKIFVKQLKLTGRIKKSHKHSVVICGMFTNRQEVIHFKDCPIYTNTGDKGHIIKPIGTHGTFKCHFTLPSYDKQDVHICLYKPYFLSCDVETEIYI